jgi:microcompartment protein CcmK/EutM
MAGQDRLLVVIDTLDAREGQEVLVSLGSGARNVLEPGPHNRDLLCDAAIALLVDGTAGESTP